MKNLEKFLYTLLFTYCAFIAINTNAQSDTNFLEMKNTFYQGYLGEEDTLEAGPITLFSKFEALYGKHYLPTGSSATAASAIDYWNENFEFYRDASNSLNANWLPLGPFDKPEGGFPTGVGRLNCITLDPVDPDNVFYIGSPWGGVWKTTNAGLDWYNLNTDYQLPNNQISDIVINPNNNNIIYVATGNRDDQYLGSISAGVYRSIDGGLNWHTVNDGLNFSGFFQIGKILLNESNPDIIYLATSSGIYKTTNATSSCIWSELTHALVFQEYFRDIEFKPDGLNTTLFASGTDILMSTDAGLNWISITGPNYGLDFNTFTLTPFPRRITLAVSPSSVNTLYANAVMTDHPTANEWNTVRRHHLFKFNGVSWTTKNSIPFSDYNINETWMAIEVSPIDANNVFMGCTLGWRSLDGGDSPLTQMYGYDLGDIHPDIHDIKYSPDGTKIYYATDGGFYRINNPHILVPFNTNTQTNYLDIDERNNGLAISTITKFGGSDLKPDLLLIGLFDCGSYVHDPVLFPTRPWYPTNGGDGCEQIVDYSNTDFFFSSAQKNYIKRYEPHPSSPSPYKTRTLPKPYDFNCGPTSTENSEFIADYTLHTSDPEYIYVNFSDLYKFKKATLLNYWLVEQVSHFDTDFGHECDDYLTATAIAQNDPKTIYCAVMYEDPSNQNEYTRLYKTTTGGYDNGCSSNCWIEITLPGDPHYITDIAISSHDKNKFWISYAGYFDGERVKYYDGTSWHDYSSGLPEMPVNCLEYENESNDAIYAGTNGGVFYRDASMQDWVPFMENLPNVWVMDLEINYTVNKLRAATYGRGLWESEIGCVQSELNIEIDEDETWLYSKKVSGDIIIKPGNTLTIKGQLGLVENSRIVIERGAKLVLDGGIITSSCDDLWDGIEVWGDPTQSHDIEAAHGVLEAINGAVIENANCGIYTCKKDQNGFHEYGYDGGLIRIDEAILENNKRAIEIWPFDFENLSYVYRSDFITSQALHNGADFEAFIVMNDIDGVEIKGCTFENTRPANELPTHYRGRGIYAIESQYLVSQYEDPINGNTVNTFSKLEYGIKSLGITSSKAPTIEFSDFKYNVTGIYLSGITSASILSNTFIVESFDQLYDENIYCGLYLDNSTRYHIEANYFKHNLLTSANEDHLIGITVNNSGFLSNEIYRNTFHKLDIGVLAQNNNRNELGSQGLLIKCNDFGDGLSGTGSMDNTIDISVTAYPECEYSGIKTHQGHGASQDGPAGNKFSKNNNGITDSDFSTIPVGHWYWQHDENSEWRIELFYYDVNDMQKTVTDWDYDEYTCCPPSLQIENRDALENEIALYSTKADSVDNLLDIQVDGGNTQELESDILLSTPDQSYALHNDLMNKSPYLTDTVMIEAVNKEDVLTSVMVKEILVANPQSAKSDDVMTELDNRVNPLPDYMIDEIEEGEAILSDKEVMEANKSYFLNRKGISENKLIKVYKEGALGTLLRDSLIVFLTNQNVPQFKYELMFEYLMKEDFNNSQSTLNDIPSQYLLNSHQQLIHNKYVDYYNVIAQLSQNGKSITDLDSIQVSSLNTISLDIYSFPGAYARNALLYNENIQYEEPYILPDNTLKLEETKDEGLKNNEEPPKYLIYPNPAKDYLVFEYNIEDVGSTAYIEFLNIDGKLVKQIQLNAKSHSKIISTNELKPGLYVCKLICDGFLIGSNKVTILK